MQVKNLAIKNFRCLGDVVITCNPITAIVGRNGAGKSTFLAALDKFFDPSSRVTEEDYYSRTLTEPISIRVTFGDLRHEEAEDFKVYTEGQTLTITKRYVWSPGVVTVTGNYFATRRRFPPFAKVRAAGSVEEMKEFMQALIDDGVLAAGFKLTTKKAIEKYMDDFELANPEQLEPLEDQAQFFGEKNVGGGKLDTNTRFVYIPAVRDVAQETGEKKTSLALLLETAVLQKVNARSEVAALPARVAEVVRSVYNPENLGGDLDELSSELNRTLQSFVADAALALKWGEPRIPQFEPPTVIPSMIEDAFDGSLSHKGHGLQRALIFTLLTHRQRNRAPSSEPEAIVTSPDVIIAIEEPELYQHPTRCRHIAEVLAVLTNSGDSPRTQVLFTTHSPYFVSLERFEDVRIARKLRVADAAPITKIESTTWETLCQKWAEGCGVAVDKVSVQAVVARALPAMGVVTSEGYFADFVVLVEGPGDVGLLSQVARRLSLNWNASGVALLPVGGKANIGAPTLILQALGIPTYFVFDGDARVTTNGKKSKGPSTQNNILLRIANQAPADFPPTTVDQAFACFEDEVESYLVQALGQDEFNRCVEAAASDLDWFDPRDILKNSKGAASFVDAVYDGGKSLPTLEGIVAAIETRARELRH